MRRVWLFVVGFVVLGFGEPAAALTIQAFNYGLGPNDTFSDGSPPPSGPGGVADYYAVFGSFGPEQTGAPGGLFFDPLVGGTPSTSATGLPVLLDLAVRRTPFDPSSPITLSKDKAFGTNAVFANILPGVDGELYGIRLQNFTAPATGGSEVLTLLMQNVGGVATVRLVKSDFVAHSNTGLGAYVPTMADLALPYFKVGLVHAADSNTIQANFCFDNVLGPCSSSSSFRVLGFGSLFEDPDPAKRWTQAAFLGVTPVDEPPPIAFVALGLAALAAVRKVRALRSASA